jgi:hypothetical protein
MTNRPPTTTLLPDGTHVLAIRDPSAPSGYRPAMYGNRTQAQAKIDKILTSQAATSDPGLRDRLSIVPIGNRFCVALAPEVGAQPAEQSHACDPAQGCGVPATDSRLLLIEESRIGDSITYRLDPEAASGLSAVLEPFSIPDAHLPTFSVLSQPSETIEGTSGPLRTEVDKDDLYRAAFSPEFATPIPREERVDYSVLSPWSNTNDTITEHRVSWRTSAGFEGHGVWMCSAQLVDALVASCNREHPSIRHWREARTRPRTADDPIEATVAALPPEGQPDWMAEHMRAYHGPSKPVTLTVEYAQIDIDMAERQMLARQHRHRSTIGFPQHSSLITNPRNRHNHGHVGQTDAPHYIYDRSHAYVTEGTARAYGDAAIRRSRLAYKLRGGRLGGDR